MYNHLIRNFIKLMMYIILLKGTILFALFCFVFLSFVTQTLSVYIMFLYRNFHFFKVFHVMFIEGV